MGDEKHDDDLLVRLPVRVRSTELGEGERLEGHTVHCPISRGARPLQHCLTCSRYVGLEVEPGQTPKLQCHVPASTAEPRRLASTDLPQTLERTWVREVMTANVTCVDSELGLAQVAAVLDENRLHSAPVVEDQGALIGVISRTDVLGGGLPPGGVSHGLPFARSGLIVDDVMTTTVATLNENASLTAAVRLFAHTGLHRVPVVSDEGEVVGVLSIADLMRWLAKVL